jgi:hypothetical protein
MWSEILLVKTALLINVSFIGFLAIVGSTIYYEDN